MHYYQFNIGDYASHTSHLDPIEDIAYRRMLDWLYTHETPLPLDSQEIARFIRMREHTAAIRDVLNEFFEKTDDGWISSRVQREIDHYRTKVEQASRAGKASAERRINGRSTDRSTDVQPTNNQEPRTNNQEPKKKATVVATPEGVSIQTWEDFKNLRKVKKAPITERVIEQIKSEAERAGWSLEQALVECVMRGWQAFKADWVNKSLLVTNKFDVAHITTPTPRNHDAALRKIEEDAKKATKPNAEIQARIADLLKK